MEAFNTMMACAMGLGGYFLVVLFCDVISAPYMKNRRDDA